MVCLCYVLFTPCLVPECRAHATFCFRGSSGRVVLISLPHIIHFGFHVRVRSAQAVQPKKGADEQVAFELSSLAKIWLAKRDHQAKTSVGRHFSAHLLQLGLYSDVCIGFRETVIAIGGRLHLTDGHLFHFRCV
jgi:hypothetical protein